jgi:RNA polymerase sigma-70 factor, ECF subfamily
MKGRPSLLTPLLIARTFAKAGRHVMLKTPQRIHRCRLSYPVESRMADHDDDHLRVEQSLRGDPDAFAGLVRRHQRMIHALTFRMTGSLAEAEDLAQEIFIQAYRQLDSFRAESRFSSWLYRIAINRCLNWQKQSRRQAQLREELPPPPATPTEAGALGQAVQDALLRLPAKQRAAIVLTVYDGLSHAEAARALGCTETTVSWRVFAARRKLKRWLQPLAGRHE